MRLISRLIVEAARPSSAAIREEAELEWTFISPCATLDPGEKTGNYRIGGNRLMVDEAGNSFISMEDYAIALIDEAERADHIRKRIQIGHLLKRAFSSVCLLTVDTMIWMFFR